MKLGQIIANALTAALVVWLLAIALLLFGRPLWPETKARMVILMPVDAMTTTSVEIDTHPNLPETFDVKLALPRPELQ
ncbi:polymerase [Mesorhizobium sp. M1338]|uniref:polymerase n=1 Tax=unclassified Mesorhizobium TaxID=325217 RepID=UPI003338B9CD